MPPKSLIASTRDRYFSAIRSVQPASRWKILVVDGYTKTLLNSVLKMYDVLQQNVSTVENIEMQRQPQTGFEAAYLLCPTSQNVDRVIRDLAPEDGRPPQYAAGHIFFIDALSNSLLQKLTSSPAEPKLRQLIELYTNFWPVEAQVFSLKSPQSFFTLFQPIGGTFGPDPSEAASALEEELHFTTQTLLNVCVTLNEFPLIRYYNPSHPPLGAAAAASSQQQQGSMRMNRARGDGSGDHFTKRLALRLQLALDKYVQENEPKIDVGRPKGVLFITDRTMDTVAPFLHEFSYQAMVHDLLPIVDGNKYSYRFYNSEGEREDKEATLSDEDNVWQAIRHMHIVEAIDKLSRDFKQHAGEAGHFSTANSLNDMRDMLASLPHMQEMKDKLSLHLTMAQACMNKFEQSRLPAQAMVEQNCATRTTPEGQKPRTLVEEMVPLLDDPEVSNADKVRIIALYVMYSDGVPDEDRKRLFQHARLGLSEMEAVNNLIHLGARVLRDPTNSTWDAWFKKGKRKQVSGENEYELSRYQPLVKLMVEDHLAGKLDQSTYPYVRDAPPETPSGGINSVVGGASGLVSSVTKSSAASGTSLRPQPSSLRSAKPTWHQKGRPGAGNGAGSSIGGLDTSRQRMIVFVAGGMTYSEVRSAYEVSEKLGKDMYIGSSDFFTPKSFIDSVRSLGKASSHVGGNSHHHSHSIPNGSNKLSAPANEVSGIRSQANKVRQMPIIHPNSQGQQGSSLNYEQELETNQGSYDRRFRSPDQPISPSAQQQQYNGGSHDIPHSSPQHASLRTASPAPSSISTASGLGKEKKRIKNPFSFGKKG
ncbi:Sec1-like protein [Meira miltonrushii]|uniref:Sec1-like protein n=1 Tax=Meira miltonrushii TaxID=1280837 RepID=A0A316VEC7_9BASI|nr:Sec1-like protein [Meira miltonrushii]PWN35654.1 Sec1-like protein [Meira miltonrushii]